MKGITVQFRGSISGTPSHVTHRMAESGGSVEWRARRAAGAESGGSGEWRERRGAGAEMSREREREGGREGRREG